MKKIRKGVSSTVRCSRKVALSLPKIQVLTDRPGNRNWEPRYAEPILEHLIDLKSDGSFRLDMDYFNHCTGLTVTNERFDELFGGPPRQPDELFEQRHIDLAASIQVEPAPTQRPSCRLHNAGHAAHTHGEWFQSKAS